MTFLQRHFPKNKSSWKAYLKIFLPIIAGSTLFAFNGVVDNFMVGHIDQGVTALGTINSWTNILLGWFLGTSAAGSVVMAQFYHAKKFDVVKQIARYRYILTMAAAILLAIVAWTAPDVLTRTFYSGHNQAVMEKAREYTTIIAIQWLMISITFNFGNQLREIGLGKYSMYWGVGALLANITLNAALMYGYHMGVAGAAWASVAGRVISFSSGLFVIIWKKLEIGFKPWTIFKVSWRVQKLFWKRWVYFMSIFTATFFVTYRNFFYDRGFTTNSLGVGIGGLSVLGLTTALMNVFMTTFSSLASMSAVFVGSELGKGNLKLAKTRGDELKGFTSMMALFLAVIAIIFALCVPYMTFLSEGQTIKDHQALLEFKKDYGMGAGKYWFDQSIFDNAKIGSVSFDSVRQLTEVRNSICVLAVYYPIWIWFSASYRIGNSGGKGGWFAFIDWFVSGPIQLGWLAILMLVIVPSSPFLQNNFAMAYFLFFISDLLKLLGQEILYYKYKWLNSLTQEETIEKEASAKKYINENINKP